MANIDTEIGDAWRPGISSTRTFPIPHLKSMMIAIKHTHYGRRTASPLALSVHHLALPRAATISFGSTEAEHRGINGDDLSPRHGCPVQTVSIRSRPPRTPATSRNSQCLSSCVTCIGPSLRRLPPQGHTRSGGRSTKLPLVKVRKRLQTVSHYWCTISLNRLVQFSLRHLANRAI